MDADLLHPLMHKMYLKALQDLGSGWKGYSGYRSFEEQSELFKQGRSKEGKIVTRAMAGFSAHNYGIAVDMADFSLKDPWSANYDALSKWCVDNKMIWGGNFHIVDKPHIQLDLGISFLDLREKLKLYGKKEVDRLISLYGAKYGV